MNDPTLLGTLLRGAISLGVLLVVSGIAARFCRTDVHWWIASAVFAVPFAWLLLVSAPRPHEAGLPYAAQWGLCGAAVFAAYRAWLLRGAGGAGAEPDSAPEGSTEPPGDHGPL